MRFVLGLSLTASSAVWALVDTDDGTIVADEVVALDSLHEIARAAALSVQAFDAKTEHDIEAIRLTWTDDAHQDGTRLRTKLRLFGFETVETVSEEEAREGRNKTARHLAPHLTLAYGAARSDPGDNETGSVIQRLAALVPRPVAARVPAPLAAWPPNRLAAASAAAAAAVVAVGVAIGLYGFGSHSPSEAPYTAAAEPNAQARPQARPAPISAPPKAVPPSVAKPPTDPAPSPVPEPVSAWLPETTVAQPEIVAAPESATEVYLDSTVPESLPTTVGVPHLPAAQHLSRPGRATAAPPAAGPVMPANAPAQQPWAVAAPPAPLPPAPLPPVLSSLFGALP